MREHELQGINERLVIVVASRDGLMNILSKEWAHPFVKMLPPFKVYKYVFPFDLTGKPFAILTKMYLKKLTTEQLQLMLKNGLDLGVPVKFVEQAEAIDSYNFGVGHTPVDGSIYIRHPIFPNSYILPDDFSRVLASEKEAAFRQLASALGAKEIRLFNAKVHSTKGVFGTKVSIPEAATQIGVKVKVNKDGSLVRDIYSKFGRPFSMPAIPPDLKEWTEMDPDLRTMARDRIEANLLESKVTLEFKEGYGAGGEVSSKIAGKGISISAAYERLYHSVWVFDVEYWSIDEIREGMQGQVLESHISH